MQVSVFDSFSRQISITAITGYQRYISPHKGFKCAHRVLHGGESCSQYVKQVITNNGLKTALLEMKQRFKACKQANHILHSQMENPELPKENAETESNKTAPIKMPSNRSFFNNDSTNCMDCADLSCNCVELSNIVPDCSIVHCNSLDCGALDCSSLDCSALDCGGCSW